MEDTAPRPSRGRATLAAGIALVVVGLAAFAVFAALPIGLGSGRSGGGEPGVSTTDPVEAWRALMWIGAAVVTGAGAVLVALSVVRRHRRRALHRAA